MAEYSLGTAKGRVVIDYDDKGLKIAADDFERTEGKARSAAQGFSQAGDKMALAGVVIAAGLGLAAKTAIDFEKQISAIGAVSGATKAELELLRQKALQIGKDTSFSATQAALAMEELAKAGVSVTDIMSGAADATVSLAAAGGVELPAAAELAADAMNAFSLTAKDLPRVADLIAGAANSSSISMGDFGQSLKQVGAVANLAGLSFQDTATAIALLGQQGIKGSDAGTSLKTMLSNLIPVTDKQRALFKELGLLTKSGSSAFFDMQGNVKGLAEISGILQNATKGMTAEQKQLTLETIFGSDAIRAAAVLTKSGAEGFNEMAAAMQKTSAADVAAARLDNTAGAIEKLKGSAETLAISLGTILLPFITKIARALESAANWFNGLSDSTKSTIVTIALVTSTVLIAMAAIIKIVNFIKAFIVVWRLLNLAFIASPIGLIITAIIILIGIIILIATKTTWFQDLWAAAWGWIKKAAAAVADWFMNKIVPSLKAAWDQLWAIVKFFIDLIVGYFKFWLMVGELVWKGIVAVVQWAIQQIKNHVEFIKAIVDMVSNFFNRMKEAVVSRLTEAVNFVKQIPGKINEALGNLGALLYNKGRDVVQGLIDGILSMIQKVKNAAGQLVNAIGRFMPGSPAEEGPLSGKGYVLKRGQRLVDDFASGILGKARIVREAMKSMMTGAVGSLPVNAATSVSTAQAGIAPINVAIPSAAAAQAGNNSAVTIQNLNITGTWDMADPSVPRTFVARLHNELDRYEKGYR